MRTEDNDVASRVPLRPTEHPSSVEEEQMISTKLDTREPQSEMEALIVGGDAFTNREARPEAFFNESSRDAMLLYHDASRLISRRAPMHSR